MDNLSAAEKNAFEEDLRRFRKNEQDADEREERIKDMVYCMTQEGEEYYPFNPKNLAEAIAQMDAYDVISMGSYAHVASKFPSDITNAQLVNFILNRSKKYWDDVARHVVERDKLVD